MSTETAPPGGHPTLPGPSAATVVVPAPPRRVRRPLPGTALLRYDAPWTVLLAALVVWIGLSSDTGQDLQSTTPALLVSTLLSGVIGVAAVLIGRSTSRPWGVGVAVAAVAVVLVTGASISWAVAPATAWNETNRVLTYLAVMLAGVAAARTAPSRWAVLPTGILLGTSVILVLGLLAKVFPATFEPDEIFARLQQPLGYWNAVGALAAVNAVLVLWFGTRRHGYRPLNALAYPALMIAVAVLLMSYSRGALLAFGIGVAFWLLLAPRRLHSLLLLGVGGVAGVFVGIWAFANTALSTDAVLLAARESSGTQLGVLLLGTILLLLVLGMAIEFSLLFAGIQRHERRRIGALILCLAALVPVAGTGMLATSERGLGGSLSHAWKQLTDPETSGPASDPTRLGAVGSQRSLYWSQAFNVYRVQPTRGVGAGGFGVIQDRARGANPTIVEHAHGWVPQTLADGGWTALALQALLGIAWLLAALRALGVWGPLRGTRGDPEHAATAAMVGAVVALAVTAAIDWTWFIPALMLPIALLVGWGAGRGAERAVAAPATPTAPVVRDRRWWATHGLVAALLVVATAAALVSIAQPWRAERLQDQALEALNAGDLPRAEALARDAASINPLSPRAEYSLAQVRVAQDRIADARELHRRATVLEPSVTTSWQRWAAFELNVADDPAAALRLSGIALKMAPTSQPALRTALAAQQALAERSAAATDAPAPDGADAAPDGADAPAPDDGADAAPAP